ncbi:urease accessory protein UreF [Synechococcales cyanobacterium C]|uniref:Urease accessory protein UreF n=1 Tax=Petrachloros mirabilis ULC683 TaxID=2781853 RepID=A0A8K2A8K4_9CYAN|nr:urease accessory protein UreF [Petrachloros mirabilis]NCJ08134.1 urease accessory protein UreF [Petrachloros mirabilis ULC683]
MSNFQSSSQADGALLRLLQLASPALPVGAYSYSEGLETLVSQGVIGTAADLEQWLSQELRWGAIRVDAAVMLRSFEAVRTQNWAQVTDWNRWLSAARETEELRSQHWQMGRSLLHLLLETQAAVSLPPTLVQTLELESCNYAIAFGAMAATWEITAPAALLGYLQSWATNLVNAGVKLIPLGQTVGQQLLLSLHSPLLQAQADLLHLADSDLESWSWGLSLASMAHETQYSRLFRS